MKKNRINIVAYADPLDVGLRLTDNGTYEWRVTKAKWGEFRHNLIMLFGNYNYKPIHFKSNSTDKKDLQVEFSLDEFKQFQIYGLTDICLTIEWGHVSEQS